MEGIPGNEGKVEDQVGGEKGSRSFTLFCPLADGSAIYQVALFLQDGAPGGMGSADEGRETGDEGEACLSKKERDTGIRHFMKR